MFLEFANGKEPVEDGHRMDHATCFQYYNPKILDYIFQNLMSYLKSSVQNILKN